MKATKMLENLVSAGLTDDEARSIVKGKVEEGAVEDDGIAKSDNAIDFAADIKAVEVAADAIAKAVGNTSVSSASDSDGNDAAVGGHPELNKPIQKDALAEEEEESEEEGGESEEEEGEDMEYSKKSRASSNEDYDVVAIISKGADQILDSVERQNSALAKGYNQLSDVTVNLVKAVSAQAKRYDDLCDRFDTVIKALGEPVPPRSVSGTLEIVPAPGEAVVTKSEGVHPRMALLNKANDEIRASDDSVRQHELALAVAELDSGATPESVSARYNISIG